MPWTFDLRRGFWNKLLVSRSRRGLLRDIYCFDLAIVVSLFSRLSRKKYLDWRTVDSFNSVYSAKVNPYLLDSLNIQVFVKVIKFVKFINFLRSTFLIQDDELSATVRMPVMSGSVIG